VLAKRNVHHMDDTVHAANETERTILAVRIAKLRDRRTHKEAKDNKAATMSPAEKTHTRSNSRRERMKHTPSV
jgi:hypothetical protein